MGFKVIDLDTEEGRKKYDKMRKTNSVREAFEGSGEKFTENFAPRTEQPQEVVKSEEPSEAVTDNSNVVRRGVVKGVENLRVRKDPGGEVMNLISENSIVEILDETGDWFFVEPTPGKRGYVMKKYIKVYTEGG